MLVIEHQSRVTGQFVERGASLEFSFDLDAEMRRALICSKSGVPLVESTLADGIETTTYLGRLTVFGRPRDRDPRVIGDKCAMAELARMPEAALFQPLREALEEHGVSRDVYAAPRRSPGCDGQTSPWAATYLSPGDRVVVPTWSWWWSTAIDVWSWNGPARYQLTDGLATWADTVNGWSRTAPVWSWWTVTVTNLYSADALGVDGTLL